MAIPPRGVSQIRKLLAIRCSRAQSNARHVHQFRLAGLELECSRLLLEKQAAERRIEGILARLAEIQQKMRQHRALLDRDEKVASPPAALPTARTLRY
jgi:hypothetical protein